MHTITYTAILLHDEIINAQLLNTLIYKTVGQEA